MTAAVPPAREEHRTVEEQTGNRLGYPPTSWMGPEGEGHRSHDQYGEEMAYWFGAVVRTCRMKGSSQLVVSMSREREREREREYNNIDIHLTYLKSAATVPRPVQRYDSALLNP